MAIIQSIFFVISLGCFLLVLKGFSMSCGKLVDNSAQSSIANNKSVISVALSGAVLTAIMQSSSVVVMIIIGLVEGEILSEKHGLAAIMGTEIGTTMTGQLLSIPKQIFIYIIPIVFLIVITIPKIKKFKKPFYWLVFLILTMYIMSLPLKGMINQEHSIIRALLLSANERRLVGIFVGLGLTALVQSSSALTAITINLAQLEILNLEGAMALILGANIGTCVTGLIACLAFSNKIKRIILGQIIFNFFGVLVFYTLFDPFIKLIVLITRSGLVERQIANGQTLFNTLSFLIILPVFNYYYLMIKKIASKLQKRGKL